jgi:ribosome biogenesis GTPase
MVIDTPGMRELQLWGDERGLRQAFDDIEELASGCRFRDCNHDSEPGCAIKAAIESGTLSEERYESYLKLKRELHYLAARQMMTANKVEKLRWKQVAMIQKKMKKKE